MSRLGKYLDWAELSWNEWIINYDFKHQMQVAQGFQQRNSRTWRGIRPRMAQPNPTKKQRPDELLASTARRTGHRGPITLLILFVILQNSKLLTQNTSQNQFAMAVAREVTQKRANPPACFAAL